MEKCKICGKHKSEDKLPPRTLDLDLRLHEKDGDLARIMYRLTQDIVVSKNFSDENITRICEKYLRKTSHSSNNVLLRAIEDLKIKLNVRNESSNICSNAHDARNKADLLNNPEREEYLMVDKGISAQSLLSTSRVGCAEKLSPISSITTLENSTSRESEPYQPRIEIASHRSTSYLKSDVEFGNNPASSTDSSVDAITRIVTASKKRKYN